MNVGPEGSEHLLCQGLLESIHAMLNLDVKPELVGWIYFAIRVAILTFLPAAIWIPYCFWVSKKPDDAAIEFYKKMRISSFGWKHIEEMTGLASPRGEFKMNFIGWIVTCFALFGILLGTGSIIFQQWGQALIYLPIGLIASCFTWKIMSGETFASMATEEEEAAEIDDVSDEECSATE